MRSIDSVSAGYVMVILAAKCVASKPAIWRNTVLIAVFARAFIWSSDQNKPFSSTRVLANALSKCHCFHPPYILEGRKYFEPLFGPLPLWCENVPWLARISSPCRS